MSTPRKKRTAKEIFNAAVEYYEPRQWEGYIVDACGEDETLRQRVRELLEAHRQSDSFLDGNAERTDDLAISERPGTLIGPYKLLQEIGEGGFGVVYMAEQLEPVRRKVALKIIKPGMDTKQVIARFEAERQALAMMDHPNIAKVLAAGATESGRPYFVMELVKGVPITEFCDSNKLGARDRLELFVAVCRAVQHAHQKGLIHRDLKPTNVMVTLHDNKPMPVIIDFGVSKAISQQLTEKTLFTAYGQMVGTPAYMSPEQAQMSRMDIDTRSDIYSLGVLLYELLTGGPPLDEERLRGTAYVELQRLISEEEAPKPSARLSTLGKALAEIAQQRGTDPKRLGQFLRGDLDWIVMKALEKERSRRYDTANGLANDVERFLNDEAVEACPPSATYRLRKYVQRNRSLVIAGSLITASLLIGLVVSVAGFFQAARQRDRALFAEQKAFAGANEASRERDTAQHERDRAVNAEAAAKQRSEEAEAVIDLLGEMIGSTDPEDLKGPNYTVRQLLHDFAVKLDDQLTDQPAVEATVHLMISDVYLQFRMNEPGLLHAEKAYELRRDLYGDEHELTIRALRAKGLHMVLMPSNDKSRVGRQILSEIVELHPPFMDEDHEFTLRTKNGAAIFLGGEPGIVRFRELLDEAESKLGPDHHITSIIRANYAGLLAGARRLDEAESHFRQAVTAQEALAGADAPLASFYRFRLAGVLFTQGDHETAKRVLLQELALQRKQLGHSHRDTLATLGKLVMVLYDRDEAQVADDLVSEFIERMQSEDEPQSLSNVQWLVRVASNREISGRPATVRLFEAATPMYLDVLRGADAEATSSGQELGISILRALVSNDRSDLAERVARAAWDVYGNEHAEPELVSTLARTMLSNDKLEAVVNFVQQDLSPESDCYRELDRNSDGKLTSTELRGFWLQSHFAKIDKNADDILTQDDTGEALWHFVADADLNEDGKIVQDERRQAFLPVFFIRLDRNEDGQISDEEIGSNAFVRRLDGNGDGTVTESEFIEAFASRGVGVRTPRFPVQPLTPEEEFTQNDQDANDHVSIDEAAEKFWKSIAEFDVNEDNAVDLTEYEQGLRKRKLEKAERFFSQMDRNSDGQASQDEVPSRLWERWHGFDSNGDQTLNKDEFMKAQTANIIPNDKQ